ncbi:hypothetical protein [Bradyrhizobium sp. 180]|nr:hypothetical protein [Bradyrhizobium sp. 180]
MTEALARRMPTMIVGSASSAPRDPERLDLLHRRDRVEQERPGAAIYITS